MPKGYSTTTGNNGRFKDITGRKFGKLTVISIAGSVGGYSRWNCSCQCGKSVVVQGVKLRVGNTKSCGCARINKLRKISRVHGHTIGKRTPTYITWRAMIERCTDPNNKAYANYGGRGIKVCRRWKKNFNNFLADMGHRPKNMTIERTDNDGDYRPSNCVWASSSQQNRNKRKSP